MYPSDYAYTYAFGVDNKCYTDTFSCIKSTLTSSWLYNNRAHQWLISPFSGESSSAFLLYWDGNVTINYNVANAFGGRPSTYLLSSIQLDKGTGAEDDPYTLKQA